MRWTDRDRKRARHPHTTLHTKCRLCALCAPSSRELTIKFEYLNNIFKTFAVSSKFKCPDIYLNILFNYSAFRSYNFSFSIFLSNTSFKFPVSFLYDLFTSPSDSWICHLPTCSCSTWFQSLFFIILCLLPIHT